MDREKQSESVLDTFVEVERRQGRCFWVNIDGGAGGGAHSFLHSRVC